MMDKKSKLLQKLAEGLDWVRENPERKIEIAHSSGCKISTIFLIDNNEWETTVSGAPNGSIYENDWNRRYKFPVAAAEDIISIGLELENKRYDE